MNQFLRQGSLARPSQRSVSFFHTSTLRLHKWQEQEDSDLIAEYERIGPAWSLLCGRLPGRNPEECRRRWLKISGVLDAEKYPADRQKWLDGYERMKAAGKDGLEVYVWIKVPIDPPELDPFQRIAQSLPIHKFNWQKKNAGWSKTEFLALREGFEQYCEGKEAEEAAEGWKKIARRFSRRTATQCQNFFENQHRLWNWQEKLKALQSKYSTTEDKRDSATA